MGRYGNKLMLFWGMWPRRSGGMARDMGFLTAARRQVEGCAAIDNAIARLQREHAGMSELARRVDRAIESYPSEMAREAVERYYRQGQTTEGIGMALYASEGQVSEYIRNVQIAALVAVRCMEMERPCGVETLFWGGK